MRAQNSAEAFYDKVIFDSEENARFPSSPFISEYGIEENALKHIRVIYIYNRINGFSELRHQDDNIWDHSPTCDKI